MLAVILLPYLLSRAQSPWRQVAIRQNAAIDLVATSPTQPLRIAMYRIAHGRGLAADNWQRGSPAERAERRQEIGDLLKQTHADIVVLNEVDFGASWSSSFEAG